MTQSTQPSRQTTTDDRYLPSSVYLNSAYYGWLTAVSSDLDQPVVRAPDVTQTLYDEIVQLLTLEARLLDQRAYEKWLDLFTQECVYWIPATNPATDPRGTVTLEFHDRRRLIDRFARLGTGLAYAQLPASNTARQFGGVEVWPNPEDVKEWRVRCSFTVVESRQGKSRTLAGWNGFVLRREADSLKIVLKQINLLDREHPQGNNSFFL